VVASVVAPAAADRVLLERVLTETGVERTPVPPQSSYLGELWRSFLRAVAEMFARLGEMLHLDKGTLLWLAVALVALALIALGWLLVTARRRRAKTPGAAGPPDAEAFDAAVAGRDAAAWRAELERCLAEERIGDALRAAWWWLARTIAGPAAEPDWTSRELATRTGRRELRDLLRRLDVLTYGAARPGLSDVRRLAEQIRGVLG
jgi:hypothetical protein